MDSVIHHGMRAWFSVLGILICGCAAVQPGPTASGARLNPPGAASESRTQPTPDQWWLPPASSARLPAPPPPAGTTCMLPFSEISEANGGFILYPSGRRVDDPKSQVALPGNQPGAPGQNPGLTYDVPAGKWVPVPLSSLSPDGHVYAYFWQGTIHAVNVLTGESGVVVTGGWNLIGVADDGVYASQGNTPGASFIPFGQDPHQIVDHGTWMRFHDGALWGTDSSLQLIRFDVTTHTETAWGTVTRVAYITGFDAAGEPVVSSGGALAIFHDNGTTTQVWPGTNGLTSSGYVFGDAYGVWFEVDGASGIPGAPGAGIYLWTPGGGANQVSTEAVHPMGPCI